MLPYKFAEYIPLLFWLIKPTRAIFLCPKINGKRRKMGLLEHFIKNALTARYGEKNKSLLKRLWDDDPLIDRNKICPICRREIDIRATICEYCGCRFK